MTISNTGLPVIYGYTSTSASTTAKVVSSTASSNPFTGYKRNQKYVIEFTNGNTASTPTISINGAGSVTVRHITTNGSTTTSPGAAIMYSRTRTIWTFVYDGTYMIPIGRTTRPAARDTLMTGYSKASSSSAITTSDTVSSAIGKLEYKIDNSGGGGGSGLTYSYTRTVFNTNTPGQSMNITLDTNCKFIEFVAAEDPDYGRFLESNMISKSRLLHDPQVMGYQILTNYTSFAYMTGVNSVEVHRGSVWPSYIIIIQHMLS
jgi:hypothetical protein